VRTVYVLGAGASKAVDERMPLISDFGTCEVGSSLLNQSDFSGLPDSLEEFGIPPERFRSGEVNVEDALSAVIQTEGGIADGVGDHLIDFICLVLQMSQSSSILSWGLYDKFIRLLSAEDTVITLNYDLLLDAALLRSRRWNQSTGYGLAFTGIAGLNETIALVPRTEASALAYLKLHGSMHWLLESRSRIRLRMDPHDMKPLPLDRIPSTDEVQMGMFETDSSARRSVVLDPEPLRRLPAYHPRRRRGLYQDGLHVMVTPLIVPPMTSKDIAGADDYQPLGALWQTASERLREADRIVVIGCSLREADHELISLLRESLGEDSRDSIAAEAVDPQCALIADRLKELAPTKITAVKQCPSLDAYLD